MKTALRILLFGCLLQTMASFAQPYCQPQYGLPSGIYIDGFTLGSINNVGSGSTPVPGYTNYQHTGPNSITSVTPGGSYPVTITAGPVIPLDGEPVYYAIWVDLDHDFDYEANERIFLTTTTVPNEVALVNLEIPADALTGYTGLRVMCVPGFAAPNDACGSYNWGETEDYTLVIDDGAPCIPMYGYGSIDGDYITDFVLENVVNQATGGDTYTDYGAQGLVIRLAPGTEYFPIITSGTYDPSPDHYEYLSVWIDLDQNGTFEPDEKLAVATTEAPFESVTPSLFIPTDAPTGITRMRVMCVHNEDPTDACGIYFYGETEDYSVIIDDGAPCIPVYSNGTSSGNYIDAFVMGDINNTGSGSITSYSDFTTSGPGYITKVVPGSINTATIGSGGGGENDTYAIWVDLDRDLSFEPNELLASQLTSGSGVQSTLVSFTIPANAQPGYTRMRVMCANEQTLTDACGTYSYGETEDYTIVIDDGSPCIPIFGYQGSDGDYVSAVQLADLNWSLAPGEEPQGYMPPVYGAHLSAGYSGTLTVTSGSYASDLLTAWLDLDGDGFSGDLIGVQEVNSPFATATFPVNIPDDFVGYAVLRVICSSAIMDNDGCAGLGGYGTTTDFAIVVGHAGMPCYPLYASGTSAGDGIDSLVLGSHTYFGSLEFPYASAHVENEHRYDAGENEVIQLRSRAATFNGYTLLLDMNNDGDFSDPQELVGFLTNSEPDELITFNLSIPAICPPGQHWLRVRCHPGTAMLADPCQETGFGNMIDVLLVVEDPNGPCIPYSPAWTTDGDFIDGVQLGGAQNLGTGGPWGPAYSAYLSPAISVIAGVPDTLRITGGAYPGDSYSAWIDYNGDNDFDDANELLGWIGIADPYAVGELPFTVPNGTVPVNKRMRVRCSYSVVSDACATMGWGETEDYTVSIELSTGVLAATIADLRLLPTTDGVQLLTDASHIGNTYTLSEATGRIMATGRITTDRTDLPMLDFAHGAYTVQVFDGDARAVKRFVW